MTISIWRYSHLALAVSSFLLLTLAAVSGIILAFEPAAKKMQPYKVANFDELTLATALPEIRKAYPEITDISVDANQFVVLRGADENGENIEIYIDPSTGEKLGVPQPQSPFFQWVTALHRSLFLKEIGRFFVGLTSFLLFLITISGTILIIQRQSGIKRFFKAIVKENFAQYYHVTLGRWSLIPIIIIALTGTYLSMARFGLIEEASVNHELDFDKMRMEKTGKLADFTVLQNIPLSEVKSVEFPFSEDPEDYYTIKLKDRELVINQVNGDVLSEMKYPFTAVLSSLSFDLHTGQSSLVWAFIIAVATANILFFIYSGFAITFKRRAARIRNRYAPGRSEVIILVGSENGTTLAFAKTIAKQLDLAGKTWHIAELNRYQTYESAEHILVLTATYGVGGPPSNATRFLSLAEQIEQTNACTFSVLGFGSHGYPDFCQFAYEVNNALLAKSWAKPLLELHTVNDRSPNDFLLWYSQWAEKLGLAMMELSEEFTAKPKRLRSYQVDSKSSDAQIGETFLIRFKPVKEEKFQSGDLMAIYPGDDYRERLYSIGKVGHEVMLSVKVHEQGLGSGFLNRLAPGDRIQARIVANAHFHFPKQVERVIMVSNGTGIAPFLGMLQEKGKNAEVHLYSGFRNSLSCVVYMPVLQEALDHRRLHKLNLAFSREGAKEYVKDILARDEQLLADTLRSGGAIMICGSLAMEQNVLDLLSAICERSGLEPVSHFQGRGKILTDCY